MITDQLLQKYPIVSDQMSHSRLRVVLNALEKVLQSNVSGDVVEFGCYVGTTSLFLRRMLNAYNQAGSKSLHVYDSFEGLPEKSVEDSSGAGEQFKAGEIRTSKKQLLHEFHKAGLAPPIIHKAWFNELNPTDVPVRIAFAFLDGDFYDSITDSLRLIWSRLAPNSVIAVDDFGREALPGAERAVRDFLTSKHIEDMHAEHNIAIIQHG